MNEEVSRAPSNSILTWPLHPLLFAVASVLALMASNLNQVPPAHVVGAILGSVLFAAVVFALGFLIWRHGARAGLIASIWVVGSLFYGAVFGPLNDLVEGGFEMVRSLPLALAVLVLLTFIATRLPHSVTCNLAVILNCLAVVMVATPGWQAAAFEWRNGASRGIYDPVQAAESLPPADPAQLQAKRPPDIYHFVFDRYASPATLAEYYAYDDSPLVAFLEDRGFQVQRDARSNYHRTAHSLASTFYMDYLDLLEGSPGLAGSNWQPVLAMLADHRAGRFLKARGYRFIQFGSWWTGTFHNRLADINRPHGVNEFDLLYLRGTMLRPVLHLLPDTQLTRLLNWDNAQCHRVRAQIEEIKAIGEQDQPVYVFAHFLVPHGPYNFSPEGECLTMEQSGRRGLEKGYLEQVEYAGRIIRELVVQLQTGRQNPPAIIIQSDEGPFPAREPNVAWQDQPDAILRIKTGILSAYNIPGGNHMIDEQITPVNTYRILFNALFGAKLERLPDRTFVVPDDDHLYDFHDVTGRVRAID